MMNHAATSENSIPATVSMRMSLITVQAGSVVVRWSGMSEASAPAGSPIQIHTYGPLSTSGYVFTRALFGTFSWPGTHVQPPSLPNLKP